MKKYIVLLFCFIITFLIGCSMNDKKYNLIQVWRINATEDSKLKMEILYSGKNLGELELLGKNTYKISLTNNYVEINDYATELGKYKIKSIKYFYYIYGQLEINMLKEIETFNYTFRQELLIIKNNKYEFVFEIKK